MYLLALAATFHRRILPSLVLISMNAALPKLVFAHQQGCCHGGQEKNTASGSWLAQSTEALVVGVAATPGAAAVPPPPFPLPRCLGLSSGFCSFRSGIHIRFPRRRSMLAVHQSVDVTAGDAEDDGAMIRPFAEARGVPSVEHGHFAYQRDDVASCLGHGVTVSHFVDLSTVVHS